jgi:hypothetical protein
MATPNLNLQEIVLSDKLRTDFISKINNNMEILDIKYAQLRDLLLEKTGQTTLESAVAYVDKLVNAQDATATSDKIFNGYVAYNGKERIVGTALPQPTTAQSHLMKNGLTAYDNNGNLITGIGWAHTTTATENDIVVGRTAYNEVGVLMTGNATRQMQVNVRLTGTNYSYISGWGGGIDQNGNLVIWAMSNTTAYEHINFVPKSIGVGTAGSGFNITSFDTSDPASVPHACVVTGVGIANGFEVMLDATSVNSSYDYVTLQVTVSAF